MEPVSLPLPVIFPEEIPSIRLYMDQVTTLIEERLSPLKRRPEDKLLTKTMINNYAKAQLFPPPVKKLYTKNHVMLLILIYHLKGVLALNDIHTLLAPVNAAVKADPESPAIAQLYNDFVAIQTGTAEEFSDPLRQALALAVDAARQKRLAEYLLDETLAR